MKQYLIEIIGPGLEDERVSIITKKILNLLEDAYNVGINEGIKREDITDPYRKKIDFKEWLYK